jgi:outer membrane receptor protein involved in Fe transport
MGHVALETQVATARIRIVTSIFAATIHRFVAAEPVDPSNPAGGYLYVNGGAHVGGGRISAVFNPARLVSLHGSVDLVRGWNRSISEPLPSIPPVAGRVGVMISTPAPGTFLRVGSRFALDQDRVASSLGEPSTSGFGVVDVQVGVDLGGAWSLTAGVLNLFGAEFAPHLHPVDYDQVFRIPAPGTVWDVGIRLYLARPKS